MFNTSAQSNEMFIDLRNCSFVSRYIQGPGALKYVANMLQSIQVEKVLVIAGRKAMDVLEDYGFFKFIESIGGSYTRLFFGDGFCGAECCDEEIERLTKLVSYENYDVVVGAGGGKAVDTAKAVAHILKLPLVVIPTIASTTAPCTSLSAIYTCDHVFKEYRYWGRNPYAVIVDTRIIMNAPAKWLACGIGDTICRYTEVLELAKAEDMNSFLNKLSKGKPLISTLAANVMVKTVLKYGEKAVKSVERKEYSDELEIVVEAITLLSQIAYECGGFSGLVPHAIYNGFTHLRKLDRYRGREFPCHGEIVFYGLLVDMVLKDYPEKEMVSMMRFGQSVKLATSLSELGFNDINEEELTFIAEEASKELKNVNPVEIVKAIKEVEKLHIKAMKKIHIP
jgi:glycerol dehydrogenase